MTKRIGLLLLLAAGCTRIPQSDECFVPCTVEERVDATVEWRRGASLDCEAESFIQGALANELSAEAAIRIALLNNPKVQAIFEELGLSRADLIEAGLLSNPSFEVEIRYPEKHFLKTNIEYLITSSILDIFLIPIRVKVASLEYEQTKLRVANELLNLAFEVRQAYYELLMEQQKLGQLEDLKELASIISEMNLRQSTAGNINSLELQISRSQLLQAELELAGSQTETIRLRNKLLNLLGFCEDVCPRLPEAIPEISPECLDLCRLKQIALEKRLDLQAARLEVARFMEMLGLKESWAYTNFMAGVAGEREPDGLNLLGPGFSGELPIFNYGQADRMRLYSNIRMARDRLEELTIRVCSDVAEAFQLYANYVAILEQYRKGMLPLQKTISASSEHLYNTMGLGVEKLLESKRQQVETTKNYYELIKNIAVSRVHLDRALGGYLPNLLADYTLCQEVVP